MENSKNNVTKNEHLKKYEVLAGVLNIGASDKKGQYKRSYKRGETVELDNRYVGDLLKRSQIKLKK